MAENNWLLNDSVPVPLAQEFEAAASPWVDHDWLVCLGYQMEPDSGATPSRTLMGVGI